MTHERKIARWIGPNKIGTEIGPGTAPLPGFAQPPIYVDCYKHFAGNPCRADYHGHACRLPFRDNSLDFVAASHVLEHVANPVAALAEWYRVLRPGGIIYLVVPDRRATWEHRRPLTPVEHMLADFERGTTACDATHIDEFVFEADWAMFSPGTAAEDVSAKRAELAAELHAAVAQNLEINLHFHTFEPDNVRGLIRALQHWRTRRFNWELIDFSEDFPTKSPNGVLAVLRVDKTWRERVEADLSHQGGASDWHSVLREDAQPFAEWAAQHKADRVH